MTTRRLTLTIFLLLATTTVYAGPPEAMRLASDPALSPDGKRLAFVWRGDVWIAPVEGGAARQLTMHEASDREPAFSPDGLEIVFVSDREAGNQLYAVPVAGGKPEQLTHHTASFRVQDWYPSGDALLVHAWRDHFWRSAGRFSLIMTAPPDQQPLHGNGAMTSTPSPPAASPTLEEKLERLEAILRPMGRVLVGYSGGVDSAFLAVAAHRVLGENAIAVTADSESYASGELEQARQIARQFGIRHEVVRTSVPLVLPTVESYDVSKEGIWEHGYEPNIFKIGYGYDDVNQVARQSPFVEPAGGFARAAEQQDPGSPRSSDEYGFDDWRRTCENGEELDLNASARYMAYSGTVSASYKETEKQDQYVASFSVVSDADFGQFWLREDELVLKDKRAQPDR